jgi:hypothetical protein
MGEPTLKERRKQYEKRLKGHRDTTVRGNKAMHEFVEILGPYLQDVDEALKDRGASKRRKTYLKRQRDRLCEIIELLSKAWFDVVMRTEHAIALEEAILEHDEGIAFIDPRDPNEIIERLEQITAETKADPWIEDEDL